MSTKRLYLVVLLVVVGCQQPGAGADRPTLPVEKIITEARLDKQLKINRDALLKGSSEQIRIDAASVMLFSEAPRAREILLDALKQSENSGARSAVCKALSQTRTGRELIRNKGEFIQPLLDILTTEDELSGVKLAAEAALIFEYEQIQKPLEKIATEPSLPTRARLNVIYALKLQPDMRAIFKLIKLLDDPQSQIASEAEKALKSLGIPVGKDTEARKQIINELERKGRDEFLADWVVRQEAQMRKLENELNLWQKLYLDALDRIYDSISEDAAKGKFLAGYLAGSEAKVKLWALEKVEQWRKGTKPKLPAELGPILVNLVSDRDRDVRLKTAELLALMWQLNSAQHLLEQFKIEQDDEVKTQLFVALGRACYYAFLPNSGIKISPEIRKQTLEWAAKYLFEEDSKKAQKGAEVIRRLLEQDGLASADVDGYLGLLTKRYEQQKNEADGALRGELLSAMAGLCAQSVYKDKSVRLFESLFEGALSDETDLVREAAVDGLVYIDKTKALNRFRKTLLNDSSAAVREKLINLAGEVGGQEDLVWLAERMGTTAESEPAWQTMLEIFKRSDVAVLDEWIGRFDSRSTKAELSDEQSISFLEIARLKTNGENNPEMLKNIRKKLAELYSKTGEFERAAGCLGWLYQVARTAEEKELVLAELMGVYLRWPNVKAAKDVVENCLLKKDLEPDNVVVLSIDNYLSEPPAVAEPDAILKAFAEIETAETRPMWQEQLKRWQQRFGAPEAVSEPNIAAQ